MIIKSILILSILSNLLGINFLSDKLDNALYKQESGVLNNAVAESKDLPLPFIEKNPAVNKLAERPEIGAKIYLLGDAGTGTLLLKQDIKDQVPIASTTKIMTAIVAIENYKLDDLVTISAAADSEIGSEAFLIVGEQITVKELLYCLLVKSANDAAYALAENINVSTDVGIDKFVGLMNKKAKSLGMNKTNYKDPAGLDVNGYSTAYDLFIATKYAMQNKLFRQIVDTKEYTAKSYDGQTWHQLENSNRLVNGYDYPGAVGVKTGYMPEAGHCLVSAVEQDDHLLIGVVLNTYADTATASVDESKKMFDWSINNVEW